MDKFKVKTNNVQEKVTKPSQKESAIYMERQVGQYIQGEAVDKLSKSDIKTEKASTRNINPNLDERALKNTNELGINEK